MCVQSQETLLDQCRLAGITCMALVSDKEGNYVKVNQHHSVTAALFRPGFLLTPLQLTVLYELFDERELCKSCHSVSSGKIL